MTGYDAGVEAGASASAGGAVSVGGVAAGGDGTRLRLARQARGFSQQQLAGMAGVSRQAVSAVESGLSDPSLRVALALASALGMTVEELFGSGAAVPAVPARLVAPLPAGDARVTLAPVGDELVALPLAGSAASTAGFRPADGLACRAGEGDSEGGMRAVRPIVPPRPTLVVAGCDPAIPLLELPLSLLDPPVSLRWWECASTEALRLAGRKLVHVAGAHLRGPAGEYNTGAAADVLPEGSEVIGFCSWREGLALRPGLGGPVTGVGDVARRGLRLVNRAPGSEARCVLDRELAAAGISAAAADALPGYRTEAAGHLQLAAAIATGLADAGIAAEPAALAYGLEFVPLADERFDLVIPAGVYGSREVQSLLRVLSSRWLRDQLASLPGYDASRCGQHIATLPPAPRPVPGPSAGASG